MNSHAFWPSKRIIFIIPSAFPSWSPWFITLIRRSILIFLPLDKTLTSDVTSPLGVLYFSSLSDMASNISFSWFSDRSFAFLRRADKSSIPTALPFKPTTNRNRENTQIMPFTFISIFIPLLLLLKGTILTKLIYLQWGFALLTYKVGSKAI